MRSAVRPSGCESEFEFVSESESESESESGVCIHPRGGRLTPRSGRSVLQLTRQTPARRGRESIGGGNYTQEEHHERPHLAHWAMSRGNQHHAGKSESSHCGVVVRLPKLATGVAVSYHGRLKPDSKSVS